MWIRGQPNQRKSRIVNLKNIFQSLPEHLEDEVFEQLIQSDKIKIERIISKGHVTPASQWYDQPQHEWVMVLKGEAILGFDNQPDLRLMAGDYLNIPAHQKHQVRWTDPEQETIWLAIHY